MYAVKDDTHRNNFNIKVLYIKVIFLGRGWVNQRPITPRSGDVPLIARLRN